MTSEPAKGRASRDGECLKMGFSERVGLCSLLRYCSGEVTASYLRLDGVSIPALYSTSVCPSKSCLDHPLQQVSNTCCKVCSTLCPIMFFLKTD